MPVNYPVFLYLDQNYLSGFAKRKPAFVELLPVLRGAVAAGVDALALAVALDHVALRDLERPALRTAELQPRTTGAAPGLELHQSS